MISGLEKLYNKLKPSAEKDAQGSEYETFMEEKLRIAPKKGFSLLKEYL